MKLTTDNICALIVLFSAIYAGTTLVFHLIGLSWFMLIIAAILYTLYRQSRANKP